MLVVLPLIFSVISTLRQVDNLARQMQHAVQDSTQGVEASRSIKTKILNMARSAGQYRVLRDPSILVRYEDQREQLEQAIEQLSILSSNKTLTQRLLLLLKQEGILYNKLIEMPKRPDSKQPELEEIQLLTSLIRPLPYEVSIMISEKSNAINQQIVRVQHLLLWQALALIPLAVILAVVFSVLISRPLRQIGSAINRLGSGQLSTPVVVNGPQDIRELGRLLDWLRQRLAELDEQKLVFLQHVSHELKTPLTTIREGAELLQDEIVGPLNQEQCEVARIMRDNSVQLQTQVEALLNFNSALVQETPLQPELIALDQLLASVIQKHQLTARMRQIRFTSELQSVRVWGDREQLGVLLGNLVSNAIKYSADCKEIFFKLWCENNIILLDVIDSGPGITRDEQEKIFEPFYQGRHLPQSYVKGTGLGLAIAQRYAHMHQGELTLLPSTEGAHFRLTLLQDKPKE